MTKTRNLCGAAIWALIVAGAPAAAETFVVTNAGNAGDGSLRAALAAAAAVADGTDVIFVRTENDITLTAALEFGGVDGLEIHGQGQALRASGDFPILATSATDRLTISGLRFIGTGGYSVEDQGVAGAAGIAMDVPDSAAGNARLRLRDVVVTGTAGPGIRVSDCGPDNACGDGAGGSGAGATAGIVVELMNVVVENAGVGRYDAAGIRINERGPGSIEFRAVNLTIEGVGADGVKLDEGQEGDVMVDVIGGGFSDNGVYCNPNLLAAFLPVLAAGEFPSGQLAPDAIPAPVTGSPDDDCFQREVGYHDDGSVAEYEFAIGTEDGFDIDESGPGSILARLSGTQMNGNVDDGFEFDEDGPGDLEAAFVGIFAADNIDDALNMTEAGPGDVFGTISASDFIGNGGAGVVYQEAGRGDLQVVLFRSASVGNDGGGLGVTASQDGDGDGVVYVIDTEIADGVQTVGAVIDPD